MPAIIDVRNLAKRYKLGSVGARTLRDELDGLWRRFRTRSTGPDSRADESAIDGQSRRDHPESTNDFWALDNVSFTVQPGEIVGIVGRNGAGKSTLLKVLSRITEPTEGEADLRGRVSSLLEVGTGFHPELSGRENIYLNGAIMGMKREEIRKKFDQIVAFSEVERFIDTPVKRYSSGMYVRLAFAVAAHLEPEILIIDEVLAVGDARFQQKCLTKMEDVAQQGRTVLFVSHRTAAIQSLCTRAIWLNKGRVHADGDAQTVLDSYLNSLKDSESSFRSLCGSLDIERVLLKNSAGEPTNLFRPGESMTIEIHYFARQPVVRPYLWLGFMGKSGFLFASQMSLDGFRPESLDGRGVLSCEFEQLPLLPKQKFVIQLAGQHADGHTKLFNKTDVAHFTTIGSAAALGFNAEQAERVVEASSAAMFVPYTWHFPDGRRCTVNPFAAKARTPGEALADIGAISDPIQADADAVVTNNCASV